MKKLIYIIVIISIFIGGNVTGYIWGKFAHQHHYQVLEHTELGLKDSSVSYLKYFEYNGLGFLECERQKLCLNSSGTEVVLYSSQQIFQESYPSIMDLKVDDNTVSFNDGIKRYELKILNLLNN